MLNPKTGEETSWALARMTSCHYAAAAAAIAYLGTAAEGAGAGTAAASAGTAASGAAGVGSGAVGAAGVGSAGAAAVEGGITASQVGLTTSAVGTVTSGYGQLQGIAAQGKMFRAQSQANNLRAARERINQVREARIKGAMIEQASANSGTTGSSASQGGQASVAGQLGSNLGYMNQQQAIGDQMTQASAQAASGEGISSIGMGIAKTGATIFNNRDQINDIFRS